MCTCPTIEQLDNFENCSHPDIENGYCNTCGENIYIFHMENEITNDKANINDYQFMIESFKSLPQEIKTELIDHFSREVSLPSNMRSALSLIYQYSLTLINKKRDEDRDNYGFVQSEFDNEICKFHKGKFGRKNINQINKRMTINDEHSCIIIDPPQKYVKSVSMKNNCENLIKPLKNIFDLIIKCDKDKNIYEINPELAVIAMISIFNDEQNFFNVTLNTIAKKNGISASSLKNTKESLKKIMKRCDISTDLIFE